MKRSEAVVELQKILKLWEDCRFDLAVADLILSKIEKDIGMEPPKHSFRVEQRIIDNNLALVQTSQQSWEPENEKK
jgi:hypothetical protein